MDRLWSPWRSDYVSSANSSSDADASVFSQIAAADRDAETFILWRGETVFVVMNRYPYTTGHLLVVPFREVAEYVALTTQEQQEIASVTDRCLRWLRASLSPDGFNVGMNLGRAAGAGIPEHLHVHVVPRWSGDTNFMASTAETQVLPEDLRTTYDKLRRAIDSLDDAQDDTRHVNGTPRASDAS